MHEPVNDSNVQYFGSVSKGDVIPGCLSLADAETAVVWALMIGLGYACLWCLFQEAAEPGGWLFTLLAVFGSGTVGVHPALGPRNNTLCILTGVLKLRTIQGRQGNAVQSITPHSGRWNDLQQDPSRLSQDAWTGWYARSGLRDSQRMACNQWCVPTGVMHISSCAHVIHD